MNCWYKDCPYAPTWLKLLCHLCSLPMEINLMHYWCMKANGIWLTCFIKNYSRNKNTASRNDDCSRGDKQMYCISINLTMIAHYLTLFNRFYDICVYSEEDIRLSIGLPIIIVIVKVCATSYSQLRSPWYFVNVFFTLFSPKPCKVGRSFDERRWFFGDGGSIAAVAYN